MIGFIGLSHLGIIYSAATAAKGFPLVAFHPDEELCSRLSEGEFPIAEPGLEETWSANRDCLRYTADPAELSGCDLCFVTLDVLTDEKNQSDLRPLRALIAQAAPHLSPTCTVVLMSQVPPGFTRQLQRDLSVEELYYQVETLVFGRAVERAMYPERYMVGSANLDNDFPENYGRWLQAFGCPVLPMRYESAELAKIAINFFLVSSVSTTNTLAELCEVIGADWFEIAPALRLDARIGPQAYLTPGLGLSGGNLERDLITVKRLSAESGAQAGIVDAWLRDSEYRRDWALRILRRELLAADPGARVSVWGLAYKANTHSTKNSPSLKLLQAIPEAAVRAFDPQVVLARGQFSNVEFAASALEACSGGEALVVMTPWDAFRTVDLIAVRREMTGDLIIDCHGVLDAERCHELGFRYFRLGVPPILHDAESSRNRLEARALPS